MSSINQQEQQVLLRVARQAIIRGLEKGGEPQGIELDGYSAALRRPKATFVTLYLADQLAGCIGTLTATRPLVQDVAYNAWAAANRDSRFEGIKTDDLDSLNIEIAILSELEPVSVQSEAQLKDRLSVNEHGLLLEEGGYRATFLPKVWRSLPDKTEFLSQLKLKAGLPKNYWSDEIRCFLYTTESFSDV